MFDILSITRAEAVSLLADRAPRLSNRALEELLHALARSGDPRLPKHTTIFVKDHNHD